jgi:hypothetical protein
VPASARVHSFAASKQDHHVAASADQLPARALTASTDAMLAYPLKDTVYSAPTTRVASLNLVALKARSSNDRAQTARPPIRRTYIAATSMESANTLRKHRTAGNTADDKNGARLPNAGAGAQHGSKSRVHQPAVNPLFSAPVWTETVNKSEHGGGGRRAERPQTLAGERIHDRLYSTGTIAFEAKDVSSAEPKKATVYRSSSTWSHAGLMTRQSLDQDLSFHKRPQIQVALSLSSPPLSLSRAPPPPHLSLYLCMCVLACTLFRTAALHRERWKIARTQTRTCTHTAARACTRICTHTHTHTHARAHARAHAHAHPHPHPHPHPHRKHICTTRTLSP